jgi:hypothetical protein
MSQVNYAVQQKAVAQVDSYSFSEISFHHSVVLREKVEGLD